MVKSRLSDLRSKLLCNVGHWVFLGGAFVAVVSGLFQNSFVDPSYLMGVLLLLGLFVGILDITLKETTEFLVAAIALILAGAVNVGSVPVVGDTLRVILGNIVVFVVPAVIIVALRTIWMLAQRR